jgi:hypothetical protein
MQQEPHTSCFCQRTGEMLLAACLQLECLHTCQLMYRLGITQTRHKTTGMILYTMTFINPATECLCMCQLCHAAQLATRRRHR